MSLPWRVSDAEVRRVAGIWSVVLLVVLAILGAAVNAGLLTVNDALLLGVAQVPAGRSLDVVMTWVSLLGSAEVTSVLMLALVVVPMWRRRRFMPRALIPLAIFAIGMGIELLGKGLIHQMPVPAPLARGGRFGLSLDTSYSFPSGHMFRATMVYGLVVLRWLRRGADPSWLWQCVGLIWLIGYSRVYLGQHWPTDVAGGILLGGAALGLSVALAPTESLGQESPDN